MQPQTDDALLPSVIGTDRITPRAQGRRLTPSDPRTDPHKRDLQELCHRMYVIEGRSYQYIAKQTGIDKDVVSAYVRIEAERQAARREENRAAEVNRSISIYNGIVERTLLRMDQPGARGDEARWVLQARTRVDQLQGLDAAIKVRDETPRAPLVGVSDEHVGAVLMLAVQAKVPKADGDS